jgi:hypothetical protein
MNFAEEKRNRMIAQLPDVALLNRIVEDDEAAPQEKEQFKRMADEIRAGERMRLSGKQRAWAEDVLRRLTPISATDVPKGKLVVEPECLRRENLPLKPPPRVKTEV